VGGVTAKQGLPEAADYYTEFPSDILAAGEATWRAHHVARGAWYFDNSDGGRFNLHGERGTCCTATEVETAVREKLRDELVAARVVSRALADTFQVSELTARVAHRCASVSSPQVARHGIVRELVTMAAYEVPQAWAQALDEAGFDGVFYASAYTTGDASAYGLFGPEGAPDASAGYEAKLHLTGAAACESIGIRVENPPLSREIEIIA
jgi:hypothetical protein